MRKNQFIFAIIAMVGLLVQSQSAGATDIPDEQISLFERWNSDHPGAEGDKSFGAWFNDFGPQAVATSSFLVAENENGARICSSLKDCRDEKNFFAYSFLPFCADGFAVNCIVGVKARNAKNKEIAISKRSYFPVSQKKDFEGDESYRLPTGSAPSLLEFPGLLNGAGKNTYSIGVYVIQRFTITDWEKKTFESTDPNFLANISAVELVSGDYKNREVLQITNQFGKSSLDYEVLDRHPECVIVDEGFCGKPVAFPANVEFTLQLRVNIKTHGWLHGRLANAKITYIKDSSSSVDVEITGSPSKVPSIFVESTIDKVSDSAWATVVGGDKPTNYGKSNYPPYLAVIASVRGTYMMNAYKALQSLMTDKAFTMPSFWSVRSVERGQVSASSGNKALDCLKKYGGDQGRILGFVNTNSTAYSSGPPIFNEEIATLEYSVAAPHYAKDGSLFKGNYSLQIQAGVARCLFGDIGSAVKATISILGEDGESSVATTTVTEESGWFYFQAAGFTFSSPTIRIKLEKSQSPQANPSQSPNNPKVKKIICVRGKVKRTITGVAPKCPVGFKKS